MAVRLQGNCNEVAADSGNYTKPLQCRITITEDVRPSSKRRGSTRNSSRHHNPLWCSGNTIGCAEIA